MINLQGVWNVIQGATNKIANKICAKSLLSMLLNHFESAFNIILCMRDTVVLK